MSNYRGDGHCLLCGAETKRTCKYCNQCRKDIRVKTWKNIHLKRKADKHKKNQRSRSFLLVKWLRWLMRLVCRMVNIA